MLDAYIWELNPKGYHLSNIILHIFACIILLIFFRKLKIDSTFSFVFVLLFSIIPLNINAVVWIPGRNDIIALIFILLSFLMFLNTLKKNNIIYSILHLVFLFVAFISKEQALVLPFVIIIYIYFFIPNKLKKILIWSLCWLPVYLIYFYLRNLAVKSLESDTNIFTSFVYNLQYFPEILSKFIFPFGLSGLPEYSMIHIIIGLSLILIIAYLLIRKVDILRNKLILFGIIWFILFTLPALFSNPGEARFDYLECRAYVPFIGLLLAFSAIRYEVKYKKFILYFLSLLIIVYSILNIIISQSYNDGLSFYDNIIETNSHSSLAYNNRGLIYKNQGDFQQSLSDFSNAIKVNPEFADAYFNLGALYEMSGNWSMALSALDKGLELRNTATNAYYMRANVKVKLSDTLGAIEDYQTVLEYDSTHFIALNTRGILYLQKGELDSAIKDFSRAFSINPKYIKPLLNRGLTYIYQTRYQDAINDFNIAEKLDSTNANLYFNRGNCYFLLNDTNNACLDWYKAVMLRNYESVSYISKYCK
jgi:tetratricopeptide (TPR) repeat protein